jgi:hypothetical protein
MQIVLEDVLQQNHHIPLLPFLLPLIVCHDFLPNPFVSPHTAFLIACCQFALMPPL